MILPRWSKAQPLSSAFFLPPIIDNASRCLSDSILTIFTGTTSPSIKIWLEWEILVFDISDKCTSPSIGPPILTNAPKGTNFVTIPETISPSDNSLSIVSHSSGPARLVDRAIFFDSISIFIT